jgi:hypothetical protein
VFVDSAGCRTSRGSTAVFRFKHLTDRSLRIETEVFMRKDQRHGAIKGFIGDLIALLQSRKADIQYSGERNVLRIFRPSRIPVSLIPPTSSYILFIVIAGSPGHAAAHLRDQY